LFYLALQVSLSGCAISGKGGLSESRTDGEYVLTFEDKDGDWMLVGDVPWE
jgi:auxin-responsive protein IAA